MNASPLACVLGVLMLGSLASCETYKSATYLGWTQVDAQGLMPVRENPPSLAWKRLKAHAALNDVVKLFLQSHGMPDYIIESQGLWQGGICLFYQSKNQAWMILSKGNQARTTRILGPEPIGEKDRKLFKALAELEKAAAAYSAEPEPR